MIFCSEPIFLDTNGVSWEGRSKSGIEIKGFINKDKTTAFPLYKGGK